MSNIPDSDLQDSYDEINELRALLAEVYTAMLAAGWCEDKDKLMQRVKEAGKKS